MFDDVLRELRKLSRGVKVSIDLQLDDKGYLDRCCPSQECETHFKVMFDDWRDDATVYCPLCRHDAESSEWNTPDQVEYMTQAGERFIQEKINRAMQRDARSFNARQPRDGLITMNLSCQPGRLPIPVPANATDVMTQEFSCDECGCRYASVGAAFFCPACGHNSVLETFANSMSTVKNTIAAIPTIRQALADSTDEDTAEDSIRHICENGLVKIISTFQRYAEACFDKLPNSGRFSVRRNLFQNLAESDSIWRNSTSTGYTDILTPQEYASLSRYFQQRHVFVHQDGIIDQQYIDRARDHRFDVGQRLVVAANSVSELAEIIEKLSTDLAALT